MKNLKTLLLIAVVAFGFNTLQAQGKMAHINMQELIDAMPETTALNTELEKLGKTFGDDITSAETALEAKYNKYKAEANSVTVEVLEQRKLEVEQAQRKINASKQAAQKEMQTKSQAGIEPIIKKANDAVKAVAKAQGIQYVADSSIPTFIVTDGTDLLPLVKAHLGIK